MKLFYYIRRFWEIPKGEKRIFLYGLFICSIFYFITNTIPLKFYWNILSEKKHTKQYEEKHTLHSIKMLKKTLKRIVKIFPWKLSCLVKGITFKILSNYLKIGCSLSFDAVKLENRNLVAHSFISRNNKIIYLKVDLFKDPQGLLNII